MSSPLNECATCGLDFASLAAFDEHRLGEYAPGDYHGLVEEWTPANGRRCLTVAEMESEGWKPDVRGRWSSPRLIADAERVRQHFKKPDSSRVERSGQPAIA